MTSSFAERPHKSRERTYASTVVSMLRSASSRGTDASVVAPPAECPYPTMTKLRPVGRFTYERGSRSCALAGTLSHMPASHTTSAQNARVASILEETPQLLAAARVPQLAQRLGLDLPDALARDVELLADFLERVVGIHVDTEAHAQDLGFARREAGEHRVRRLAQRLGRRGVDRRFDRRILDEIAEMRILVVADRRLHRDRFFRDLEHLADLVLGHLHTYGQLVRRRLAPHFLEHLPRDAVELVDRLDHVHRDADRP